MAKSIPWRYAQLLLPHENFGTASLEERKMFEQFCDLFWAENVRVMPPMKAPAAYNVYVGASTLPLCKMYGSRLPVQLP